jgi:hypothetical protein
LPRFSRSALVDKLRLLSPRKVRNPDRLSGGMLMILAGIAIWEASKLPFGSVRAPDAGFFPLSLAVLLFIFASGIVLNSFVSRTEPIRLSVRSWNVLIGAMTFVIYAISLTKVGFVLATLVVMLLLMRGFGSMSWGRASLIAFPSVLLSYAAFVQLGVPLPQGPLPF